MGVRQGVRYLHNDISYININTLTPTVAMGTAIKHPVPDRVEPLFIMFDIGAL